MPRTPSSRRGYGHAAATPASSRTDAIAAIYSDTHSQLRGYVAAATRTDPLTIDDACSHAWAQLLSHPDIDLATERHSIVRWLTTTAIRQARRLHEQRRLPGRDEIDGYTQNATPSAEDVAAQRARAPLELIATTDTSPVAIWAAEVLAGQGELAGAVVDRLAELAVHGSSSAYHALWNP